MSNNSFARKLDMIPKSVIYLLLILATSVPLFFDIPIPNAPQQSSQDFYAALMSVPEGGTVLLGSDWTGSTRGESKAEFVAILRILMRRNVKFAVYSAADVQAPEVARTVIEEINLERVKNHEAPYERWNQWVQLGYFSDAKNALKSFGTNFKEAVKERKDITPKGEKLPVFQSPVLNKISKLKDFSVFVLVTASDTAKFTVERCYGPDQAPLAFAVTGVMSPETEVDYSKKQLVGFCGGLAGAYDLENLMEKGINFPTKETALIKSDKYDTIPAFKGQLNKGGATRYTPPLHFAVGLMIGLIILGNIGMFMNKKGGK